MNELIAIAIEQLEQAFDMRAAELAKVQEELNAIIAALVELRATDSNREGSPDSPGTFIPEAKDQAAPSLPSSLPARYADDTEKAQVLAYAEIHGTRAASRKFKRTESTIRKWKRAAKAQAGHPASIRSIAVETLRQHRGEIPSHAQPVHNGVEVVSYPRPIPPVAKVVATTSAPKQRLGIGGKPRKGYQGGFSRATSRSVLTETDEERILDYARTHGTKAAADYFCVDQRRVHDLETRAKLEAMS